MFRILTVIAATISINLHRSYRSIGRVLGVRLLGLGTCLAIDPFETIVTAGAIIVAAASIIVHGAITSASAVIRVLITSLITGCALTVCRSLLAISRSLRWFDPFKCVISHSHNHNLCSKCRYLDLVCHALLLCQHVLATLQSQAGDSFFVVRIMLR